MKNLSRRLLRAVPRLTGTRFTARLSKALADSLTTEEFKREFGFDREVMQTRPGHYYSVIPDVAACRKRRKELFGPPERGLKGVDLRLDQQFSLAEHLGPLFADFPYRFDPETQTVRGLIAGIQARYESSERNQTFQLDAVVLQAMLRYFEPKRVVEVGSGYSSAVMLDTRERFGWDDQALVFVEPYSQEYFFPLLKAEDRDRIRLIEKPLWEVEDAVFQELQSGDLLFIDSSHVAKVGSDVYHYIFNILPLLNPGVIVHVHDIPTWFEMAPEWFERGWYWNEGQFLRAFLMYNSEFEILFHSSAMCWLHPDAPGIPALRAHLKDTFKLPHAGWTNSFYMRKR